MFIDVGQLQQQQQRGNKHKPTVTPSESGVGESIVSSNHNNSTNNMIGRHIETTTPTNARVGDSVARKCDLATSTCLENTDSAQEQENEESNPAMAEDWVSK